ncbi:MAG: hypothetical protein Q8R43_01135, partial [Alphaproteobacteria bacterium]|nr:hypothetical protein [Alphaproteobacteria bacterium]
DFSDQPTIDKMVNAAMRETETAVFKRMIEQLGFIMPDTENAAQRSILCLYGGVPRLTTQLRYNTLQTIYSLHAHQVDEDDSLRTDSQSNRGTVVVYAPSAASMQLEARNALLLAYINKGMNTIGVKFLATVELPSNFETPHDWPDNVKAAIACLQTCKSHLHNLFARCDMTEYFQHQENSQETEGFVTAIAAKFSSLCNHCGIINDRHEHLPLVAAVCAQYIMSTVDIQAGSPTALSAQAGYRQSEATFREQNGPITRVFHTLTFNTPQSRNMLFFEEINKIIAFLNTPAGTASPAGSGNDLPRLAGSPTPTSPSALEELPAAAAAAAGATSEALANTMSTLPNLSANDEARLLTILLAKKQAREETQ